MQKRELTEFGVNVKKRLVELGMTQRQLSHTVGCRDVYLNVVLHGKRSGKKYEQAIKKVLQL